MSMENYCSLEFISIVGLSSGRARSVPHCHPVDETNEIRYASICCRCREARVSPPLPLTGNPV